MQKYRPGQAADRGLRDALNVIPEDGVPAAFGAALAEALLLVHHGALATHAVGSCHVSSWEDQ